MLTVRPLLTLALLAAAALPARAQVTLDLHALDQLKGGAKPAPPHAAHAPPEPKHTRHAAERPARHKSAPKSETAAEQRRRPAAPAQAQAPEHPPATAGAQPAPAAPPPPPPAVLPAGAPPPVRLSPAEPEQAAAPPAPPAKPDSPIVTANAGGAAVPIKEGVRITFDGGRSDLSPASAARLERFAADSPKAGDASFSVLGFAAGAPEDPSTPRRLSLSRALAVRSILMAEGIPSARIYVRALGSGPAKEQAGAPPDRVDVTVSGGTGP